MANDSGRRDRPNGRHGNVNVNAGGPGNAISNANANLGGFGGDGGWGQNGGDQVRAILHVIFKHKRLILILFLAVALPGLMATLLRKPSYQAAAKVMISTARTDPTVQPTDLTRLENIQLNESLVNSEVQVIGSRDLLERVIRQLA